MKQKIYMATLALGALATSCADEFDQTYSVAMPQSLENYAYLADYKPLREYVTNPNFKLGGALEAGDFNNGGAMYQIAVSNFHEVVAGNAMKMASCVGDDGTMKFSTVTDFLNTAEAAGVSVYGHTLAWHAQQPTKWLEKLLKDKELDVDPNAKIEKLISSYSYENTPDGPFPHYAMGCEPPIVNGALHFVPTGDWSQFFVVPGSSNSLVEGDYIARVYMSASNDADGLQLTIQNGWSDAQSISASFAVKEGDQVYELQFPGVTATPNGNYDVILKPQTANATLDFKKVEFYKLESPAVEVEKELNVQTYTDGPFPFYAMGCEPPVVNGAIHFVPTGDWSQFFCMPGSNNVLSEGDYVVYLDLQSDKAADGVQFTMQNGWGSTDQNMSASVNVKEGRNTYRLSFPGILGGNYDCILKPQTADATLDLYSVTVCKIEKLNSIPLTDEEKKDTLTWALDRWIGGMMEACNGNVKAWDVVNEAISGADKDGDGNYDLQHGSEDNTTDFFWQDYLGDVDYVRIAVASARKHFAANGGNAADLKLFINDYNLESTWDDNKKLKSLINWIAKWEADGVTKIDGIGSQMHVTYSAKAEKQQKQEECVVNMLKLMAATGKLVRISELDMGYEDAAGIILETDELTEEQHKQMAAYYSFIVRKYLEIVPAAQQYGITQWCLTDSPANSGWRKNEPTGLWDLNYDRKHTYAGFAEGLQGKEYK